MKILVDAHVFDETHQGTRTYIKGLYTELIELRPNDYFYFVAYDLQKLSNEFGEHKNVSFIQLKKKKYLRLLIEIPLIIRRYKIDYAHFQYIAAPIKNCKQIVTTHDILFKDFRNLFPLKYRIVKDILFRISAYRADILFTVSEYSRNSISRHYKIPIENIGITPNGVSTRAFSVGSEDEIQELRTKYKIDKFILYVSRIEPRKNHLLLLKAFCELKLWERNYKLVFVGRKDFSFGDLDVYLDQCHKFCKENLLILESIGFYELVLFYKSTSLFVYPSIAEGFGIPPIEAISAGADVLCANTTAMSDFVFLEDDLFNPYDLNELKIKILQKINNPHDPSRSLQLIDIVTEQYSWRKSAEKFVYYLLNESNEI